MLFTARETVVCESHIRTNENIIFNSQAIPQLHTTFYSNSATYYYIIFNKTMRAYITFFTNNCFIQYNNKLPHSSFFANFIGMDIRQWMNKTF